MAAVPVPYDVFVASNSGFVNEHGAWYYDRSSYDVNSTLKPLSNAVY